MIGLLKATGVIEVNKARLETQGYKQEHRINYNAILPWKKKMGQLKVVLLVSFTRSIMVRHLPQ